MSPNLPSARSLLGALGSRISLAGLLTAALAVVGVAYGLMTDDVVTAAGALLLVPSALLLVGIGIRETLGRPMR